MATTATPTGSPQRQPSGRVAGITQTQKQALIANLQLEVTERARKLRAQYALQAQGLRTRLEMRVNRIPQALRKRKIQELVEEHADHARPKPAAPLQAASATKDKRKSDLISTDENDQENAAPQGQDLPNPKKRARTGAAANTKATRAAAKKPAPTSGVLSPRSANSRTLPKSPLKASNLSPEKRQVNTAKPSSQNSAQNATSRQVSRAVSRQGGKKGKAAAEKENVPTSEASSVRESEASNSSAGTTIVKRTAAPAKKAAGPAAKRPATAMAKKAPAKQAIPRPATAAAGRTLRKRG